MTIFLSHYQDNWIGRGYLFSKSCCSVQVLLWWNVHHRSKYWGLCWNDITLCFAARTEHKYWTSYILSIGVKVLCSSVSVTSFLGAKIVTLTDCHINQHYYARGCKYPTIWRHWFTPFTASVKLLFNTCIGVSPSPNCRHQIFNISVQI